MYDFLIGQIKTHGANYIGLDVNGVGFKIFTPNPYGYKQESQTTIFTEQIVRENEISLYGFATADDRNLFQKLLNVSGIGPKSALAIIAGGDRNGLIAAVEQGKPDYLTKFPGIGKKTAQQIVLDLKGKLGALLSDQTDLAVATTMSQALEDALAALVALGFSEKDVHRINKSLAALPDLTTDAYIQKGLKLLTK
ncbi:Holliday junction branch migration protein RuvA [Oenococcus kitaharae]|uniref:Holliday junction branch migration complex subunit RuvA n=2 Tax=Oenococcus TaxID=46254 RepID=G9WFG0_9LACO|nr:Holliday junction branch migration protein RuvA [Oenococcus kitaharae]EHN59117.1 RuvA-like Holliday junction DNA helicase [Oenococcus kitaharae DSM 17330]MCV3297042.1 Holliday junction branch migration protein RuvA [Oenococcus kitaharae]OEY81999.1 ATP-dependent DNA helicase RuvA [Oenococcus kitaharae]OEY82370.1 ATP-dependent DNA helicase RuvA [Oenococcus kitaharae]OEY82776.1 ATP-dependent DNA helicase RuvA [Oenococcus kitaharae]